MFTLYCVKVRLFPRLSEPWRGFRTITAIGACVLLLGMVCPRPLSPQITPEDSLYTLALGAYRNGFLDLAIDQFRKFIDLYPESRKVPYAWFRLGEAYRAQKRHALAEEAYQKILQAYPGHQVSSLARFRCAGVRFVRGEFAAALSDYQRFLMEDPDADHALDARFWIAESLYQMKRYPEALAAYRTYVKEAPEHEFIPQALYGIAWCLMELGRYAEAAGQFQGLLDRGPPPALLPQIHQQLGDALFEQGDYTAALEHYSAYVKLNPDSRDQVVVKQGVALSRLDRDDEAIERFRYFLAVASADDPRIPEVSLHLGHLLCEHQRYEEGVKRLALLRKRYPQHPVIPEATYQLGLCYLHLNKTDMARQCLEESMQHAVEEGLAARSALHLGNIHYREGRMEQAALVYAKAEQAREPSIAAEAGYRRAEALLLIGDHEKGVMILRSMMDKGAVEQPWMQMAGFRLGNLYEQKGDREMALGLYTRVAAMKDGTPALTQSAQERIDVLTRGAGSVQGHRNSSTGGGEQNAPLP